jgi:hypothetical protein
MVRTELLFDDGSVESADLAPTAVEIVSSGSVGVLGCGLFVDLNAPTGRLVDVDVAILELRAAVEDLSGCGVEGAVLLDTEVVADDIEGGLRHVTDRGDIAGPVPGGLNTELLGHDGDLARGGKAADLRDVATDVVDEALGDERLPLVGVVEELAHGEGGGALIADLAEVVDVFGREGVFEEKEVKFFALFGEFDGLVGAVPLVHVMEETDLVAELSARLFEELEAAAHGVGRFEQRLVVQRLEAGRGVAALGTIAGHAGQADLDADVAETLLHVLPGAGDGVSDLGTVGVGVGIDSLAHFAACELIDGHAGLAALNVPERLIDTADGIVEDRSVLPVGAVVAGLPDVLDTVCGLTEQEWLEVSFDGRLDEIGALGEGGAAVAVEAVLIGGDLDDGEADAFGRALDDADVLDAWSGHTSGCACRLSLNCWLGEGEEPGCCCHGLDDLPPFDGHAVVVLSE